MSAAAHKNLSVAFAAQFHFLMADRTAGIGSSGNSLPVATVSVLAYQHLAVFPLYKEHPLSAVRAFRICQVVMAELAFSSFDLIQQFLTVAPDFLHKIIPPQTSLCNP